jgi:TRAP-type C4-dicarboxylate transport system, small permease component
MGYYSRFLDFVERIQRMLTIAFFLATLLAVGFQVFNRLVLQLPILWTTDVSVFCFIWLALLSASTAVRTGAHFRVTAILETARMAGRPRFVLELMAWFAVIALSLVLLVLGANFALSGFQEQSPGLVLPMFWTYVAVPLCSATACLFAVEQMWRLLRNGRLADTQGGQ